MAALALACNSLIGISDVPPAADASAPGVEGGGDGNVPPTDASDAMGSGDGGTVAQDSSSDAPGDGSSPDAGHPCTDTTQDPYNCGSCNHGCLGGSCSQSKCQPFVLVGPEAGVPARLAQDGTYLYWSDTTNGAVNRSDKTTGDTLPVTRATTNPFPIAYDDAGGGVVFWGDSAGIHYCPASGCTGTPPTTAAASQVSSLAVDSTTVYWTQGASAVYTVPHKFGSSETPAALWQGDASTEQIATDGRLVYFTASDGLLHAVGIDGGGTTTSWGSPMSAPSAGIALSGSAVYWTLADPVNGQVYGASTNAPSVSVNNLAHSQQAPVFVATDGTMIYWANLPTASSGSIVGCAIASCTASVSILAQPPSSSPAALLVDDVAIYWSDNGSNAAIWKLAK